MKKEQFIKNWIGRLDWSSYWSSLISATVEDAAPTKVVMTFSHANTSLVASDFTVAGKIVTLLERDITNKILTITVSVAFVYGDTPVITFGKTGETSNVTNYIIGAGQVFNGIDEYAYISDNGALDINQASTDFCLSGIIKTGAVISTLQWIIGKNINSGPPGRYGFYINTGILRFFIETTTNSYVIQDNLVLAINTEYYVLGRIDLTNSKIYFYIDGVLQNVGGTDFTGTISTLDNKFPFILGVGINTNGTTPYNYFGGTLRDVRIYHKDIIAQIADLMLNKKLGNEVAWWNLPTLTGFDETSYDLTGVNI